VKKGESNEREGAGKDAFPTQGVCHMPSVPRFFVESRSVRGIAIEDKVQCFALVIGSPSDVRLECSLYFANPSSFAMKGY